MQVISLNRPQIAQTALVFVVTFAALACLGWVLAYWTWQWFSPQTGLRLAVVSQAASRVDSAASLFGKPPQQIAAPASAISVLGVIAASGGGSGYAILGFAQQSPRPVRERDEIAPGIRLAEVHPDKVIIERNGLFETLALPTKKTPLITASTNKK